MTGVQNDEREDRLLSALVRGDDARLTELLGEDLTLARAVFEVDDVPGWTALHLAARIGRPLAIASLVAHGADTETQTSQGWTPLHVSLEYGSQARVALMAAGARVDICASAYLDDTPGLEAALAEDPSLLESRSTGRTPLAWAAHGRALRSTALLLEHGAAPVHGELVEAARVAGADVAALLLAAGADPRGYDPRSGRTPLHAAAALEFSDDASEIARLLLDAGADPSARDDDGLTPIDIALHGCLGPRREAFEPMAHLLSDS